MELASATSHKEGEGVKKLKERQSEGLGESKTVILTLTEGQSARQRKWKPRNRLLKSHHTTVHLYIKPATETTWSNQKQTSKSVRWNVTEEVPSCVPLTSGVCCWGSRSLRVLTEAKPLLYIWTSGLQRLCFRDKQSVLWNTSSRSTPHLLNSYTRVFNGILRQQGEARCSWGRRA